MDQPSLLYEMIDKHQLRLTVSDPSYFKYDSEKFNQIALEATESLAKQNSIIAASISRVIALGYQINPQCRVINNFINVTDMLGVMIEQLSLAEKNHPANYCLIGVNFNLPDINLNQIELSRYELLNTTFYTSVENDVIKIELSGNPFQYADDRPEIINYLLQNMLTVTAVDNTEKTGLTLVRSEILEIFYVTFNNLMEKHPQLSSLVPIYFHQASKINQRTPLPYENNASLRQSSQNRYTQISQLTMGLDVTIQPVIGQIVPTQFSTRQVTELEVQEGLSSSFMAGYIQKQKGLSLNLGKIFDQFETSAQLPFIKYNTGINKKSEVDDSSLSAKKTVPVSYNRINVEFSKHSGNRRTLQNWNTTNRRIYDDEIMKGINDYYNFTERSIFFHLIFSGKPMTVALKYDGNVVIIYTYDRYQDLRFFVNFFQTINDLLQQINQIEPLMHRPHFDSTIALQILSKPSKLAGINFTYYLQSLGYRIYNFNYVIDLYWNEQYSFDRSTFNSDYSKRFNYFFDERVEDDKPRATPGDDRNTAKTRSGFVSRDTKKIVYLKQIGKYQSYTQPRKVGRKAISTELVSESDLENKYSTLAIFDLTNENRRTLRIIITNLHRLEDLMVNRTNILNTLRYYLILDESKSVVSSMLKPITSIDKSAILEILNSEMNSEEIRLNNQTYLGIIRHPFPKGKIRTILSPLFGTDTGSSRECDVKSQPFGITMYRFLYRLVTLLDSLTTQILTGKELTSIKGYISIQRIHNVIIELIGKFLTNQINKHVLFEQIESNLETLLNQLVVYYQRVIQKIPALDQTFACSPSTTTPMRGGTVTMATAKATPTTVETKTLETKTLETKTLETNTLETNTLEKTIAETAMRRPKPSSSNYNHSGGVSSSDDEFDDNASVGSLGRENSQEREVVIPVRSSVVAAAAKKTDDLDSKIKTLNKVTYLLYLYRYGLEYQNIFWMCVPSNDTVSLFEAGKVRDTNNDIITVTKRDQLFDRYRVYNYDNDSIQYRPNTQHDLGCNFLNEIITRANGDLTEGHLLFSSNSNYYIGFHSNSKNPKCYLRVINADGKYNKFYDNRLKILSSYRTTDSLAGETPSYLSDSVDTRLHTYTTYRFNIKESAVGAHAPLPGDIIQKMRLDNYRVLYTGHVSDRESFLKPFAFLSRYPHKSDLKMIPTDATSLVEKIIEYLNTNKQYFYYFNNGQLPYIFGNLDNLVKFLRHSYINETLLWQIISWPSIIFDSKGFNLFIISSMHQLQTASEMITLKMPPSYLFHAYNPKWPNLVLLENNFGYHLIYRTDSRRGENSFWLKSNDPLVYNLRQNIEATYQTIGHVPSSFLTGDDLLDMILQVNKENFPVTIKLNSVYLMEYQIIQYLVIKVFPRNESDREKPFTMPIPIQPTDSRTLQESVDAGKLPAHQLSTIDFASIDLPTFEQALQFFEIFSKITGKYTIKKLLSFQNNPSGNNGEILVHGIQTTSGLNFYFRPIIITSQQINLNPRLANLEVEANSYNYLLMDTLLLRKQTETQQNELKETNYYNQILTSLAKQISSHPKLKRQLLMAQYSDDLIPLVSQLVDHFVDFNSEITQPQLQPRPILSQYSSQTSSDQISASTDSRLLELETVSEYRLVLPTSLVTRQELIEFLVQDIRHNQYSIWKSQPGGKNPETSGLIKLNEIILNGENTELYIDKLETYSDRNFIMYLEQKNYFDSMKLVVGDAISKPTYFNKNVSYRETNLGDHIYYENNLSNPDQNLQLLKSFLQLAHITDDIHTVYDRMFQLLHQNPAYSRLYYYYYGDIYQLEYPLVKVKYGKDGRNSTNLVEIYKSIRVDSPDFLNRLKKLILDSGKCLDIDWYIIAEIYKINLLVFNRTKELNVYQNNPTRDYWIGLTEKSHILYPLVEIIKFPVGQNNLMIRDTDKISYFTQASIHRLKWNQSNYVYNSWINYLINNLQTSTEHRSDIKILFNNSYPKLEKITVENDVFQIRSDATKKLQSPDFAQRLMTFKQLLKQQFSQDSLQNILSQDDPVARKETLQSLLPLINQYLLDKTERAHLVTIISEVIAELNTSGETEESQTLIPPTIKLTRKEPVPRKEKQTDQSPDFSQRLMTFKQLLKQQYSQESLQNILSQDDPVARKETLQSLLPLINQYLLDKTERGHLVTVISEVITELGGAPGGASLPLSPPVA